MLKKNLRGDLASHRPEQAAWYGVKQFPSDANRPAASVIDELAWAEEVIRCRQAGGQALGLSYEQQWCIAQLAVSNISLSRWAIARSVALRLPMKQIVRDE